MRHALGIPSEALGFGCYGGRESFDIAFVKDQVIPKVLAELPHVHFLFMNIEPFIEHERVIFLHATVEIERKSTFINTCDAMLHARRRGETFGLAVAEFSLRDKPVLTYGRSRERAHLVVLGDSAIVYRTPEDLYQEIANFDRGANSARDVYQRLYSPRPVMERFEAALVAPAQQGDGRDLKQRLGLRPWHAARLRLSELKARVAL